MKREKLNAEQKPVPVEHDEIVNGHTWHVSAFGLETRNCAFGRMCACGYRNPESLESSPVKFKVHPKGLSVVQHKKASEPINSPGLHEALAKRRVEDV